MADHVLDDSPTPDDPLNRPEPVLNEARIVAGVSGALPLLAGIAIAAGWVQAGETDTLTAGLVAATGALVGVINASVAFWRAHKVRARVTPLADPRGASGEQLIAVGAARALVAANAANAPLPTQPESELAPINVDEDSTVVAR